MSSKRRFTRARSPEAKAQRRDTIVAAAAELFDREGLPGLTLTALAAEAELTASNLYTYFDSVEHVMLTLALRDWSDFVTTLEAELAGIAGTSLSPGEAAAAGAAAWTRALVHNPRFCSLLSILATVIQKNVSLEALVSFKRSDRALVVRQVNALHAALPQLSLEGSQGLMAPLLGLVVALWPLASPPDVMSELQAIPEFASHELDVPAELQRCAELLILGALSAQEQ